MTPTPRRLLVAILQRLGHQIRNLKHVLFFHPAGRYRRRSNTDAARLEDRVEAVADRGRELSDHLDHLDQCLHRPGLIGDLGGVKERRNDIAAGTEPDGFGDHDDWQVRAADVFP